MYGKNFAIIILLLVLLLLIFASRTEAEEQSSGIVDIQISSSANDAHELDNNTSFNSMAAATPISSTIPVGTISMWAGGDNNSQPPEGWLMANGQCISDVTYADLCSVINDTYGTGCAANQCQLPNLNGRFPVGANGLNVTHDFRVGKNGGSELVTLSINEIPSHDHFIRNFYSGGAAGSNFAFMEFLQGAGTFYGADYTDASGGGLAHENTPPYLAIGFMIKAFPDAIETTPITSTYDIDIQFSDNSLVSITRTLITTEIEHYSGSINLPQFYKSFNPIYTIAMFLIFMLIGAGMGKPTMSAIVFIGLYLTGVLQNGHPYTTYSLIIMLASYFIYKFVILRRQV